MIGSDIRAQVEMLTKAYPQIADSLDPERVEAACQVAVDSSTLSDDFGAASSGGRGENYVAAQKATHTRGVGISRLVDLFARHSRAESGLVVDALGGDGLVNRFVATLDRSDWPEIITCDASPFMVAQAWAQGLPALLQRAESSLFRTASVGGVLLAYGTHHIPRELRGTVVDEAFRIVQPGGILVLHDFLVGSPMDTWFSKVVDAYSATGHDYPHFERDEAASYLHASGFADVETFLMEDPFVMWGETREEAELELGRYLTEMYGLVRLTEERGELAAYRHTFELAQEIFRYEQPGGRYREVSSQWDDSRGKWSAVMPRDAYIGLGRKPLS
ncbi:methyltransferase domain-containing protein [Streptomyces sp. MC1]|uniref:methyltransferase domain-containing protein n=1 Tax=Streptomyces sp. MC1 TaxID=295105 RepID=UPI0018C934CB|nr:methyltransferase domain-containing protein [Streptomyces sp. MC1]MBG7696659.1 methyltransferase domain-containing protein [Streptomyces sp. MC1]